MIKRMLFYIAFVMMMVYTLACKKYPQGGWSNKAKSRLDGPGWVTGIKTWNVTVFECNFVDSVDYCRMAAAPGLSASARIAKFRFNTSSSDILVTSSDNLLYHAAFGNRKETLLFSPVLVEDTLPYKIEPPLWERNVFFPEPAGNKGGQWRWTIMKLKKDEMILIASGRQKYKLVLKSEG